MVSGYRFGDLTEEELKILRSALFLYIDQLKAHRPRITNPNMMLQCETRRMYANRMFDEVTAAQEQLEADKKKGF